MKALDLFKTLRRSASSDVPDSTIYNLISYVFGVSKIDVALDKDIIVDEGEFRRVIYLLGENVPFAYITGYEAFYGRDFYVLPGVFIPRNETELLVELALKEPFNSFLDFGTGSGAIAISLLLENPKSKGVAVEISHVGQLCTKYNAEKFEVQNRLAIVSTLPENGMFDLIISNPPYVAYELFEEVDYSVKAFEPLQAVFPEDPVMVFRNILTYSLSHLSDAGRIILEIDSYVESDLQKLASSLGFYYQVTKDLSQFDRICILSRSS